MERKKGKRKGKKKEQTKRKSRGCFSFIMITLVPEMLLYGRNSYYMF